MKRPIGFFVFGIIGFAPDLITYLNVPAYNVGVRERYQIACGGAKCEHRREKVDYLTVHFGYFVPTLIDCERQIFAA